MKNPVVVRYFTTKSSAEIACQKVEEAGFECKILEDTFMGYTLDKYKVPRKFKILVDREDYFKLAEILAKKLKK